MACRFWIAAALVLLIASVAASQEINWISKEELRAALGSADLTIIDVRVGMDWDASDVMIKGAVREDPEDVEQWAGKYPKDARLVFY